MKRRYTCRTCANFRPGAAPDMTLPAPADGDEQMGVCEAMPPETMQRSGPAEIIGLQPLVHSSRSCGEYTRHEDYDDDGGPDGDDGEPVPVPQGVHVLRPVRAACG